MTALEIAGGTFAVLFAAIGGLVAWGYLISKADERNRPIDD
jgi:hypothetical protein